MMVKRKVQIRVASYSRNHLKNVEERKFIQIDRKHLLSSCRPERVNIYIFWLSSAPGVLSTLVTSVVLYSLTRATLMSLGQDETRVCGYIYIYMCVCVYIYIYVYIYMYIYIYYVCNIISIYIHIYQSTCYIKQNNWYILK